MGHPNLSDEINRIVDMSKDKTVTLDMRTLSPGDKVEVVMDTGDKFDFTIITPAKQELHGVDDSAVAFLPAEQWNKDTKDKKNKQVKVLIGCACTFNPGAPMLMTMLHLGHLSRGRNFAMWEFGTDNCQILKREVASIRIIKHKKK